MDRLESEVRSILESRDATDHVPAFVTRDPTTLAALRLADAVATRSTTLLIEGESGTGKSLVAQRVHGRSRRHRAFRRVALDTPDATRATLEGGERAGTLFLPGLDRASLESQAEIVAWFARQLDARASDPLAPRIIAASARPLAESVERGDLRADLANRLDVVTLQLPPLRERLCDLSALIRHFAVATGHFSETDIRCSPEALAALAEHPFRGNLRELENRVRRLAALRPEPPVDASLLLKPDPASSTRATAPVRSLRELEREAIEGSLARHGNNRTRASRELGISVRTLRNKLQRYGGA